MLELGSYGYWAHFSVCSFVLCFFFVLADGVDYIVLKNNGVDYIMNQNVVIKCMLLTPN